MRQNGTRKTRAEPPSQGAIHRLFGENRVVVVNCNQRDFLVFAEEVTI